MLTGEQLLVQLVDKIQEDDPTRRDSTISSIVGFLSEVGLQLSDSQARTTHKSSSQDGAASRAPTSSIPRKRRRRDAPEDTLPHSPSPSPSPSHTLEPVPSAAERTLTRWETQVSLVASRSPESLTETARSFADSLLARVFEEKRNNRAVRTRLKAEDVRLFVNFFFSDIFGDGSRQRIYALADEFSATQADDPYPEPSRLAAGHAANTALLPEVREFFSIYSSWYQGEAEQAKVYPLILQSIRSYQLYLAFARLRKTASSPDGDELRTFLASEGFPQSRGVDIRSCILRYLSRELKTPLGRLNNVLQAQLGIYQVVQEFGLGILVLLPRVASHRITRFGIQKIQEVVRELRVLVPETVTCCALAEANILVPILRREPLPLLLASRHDARSTLSLAEALTAVNPLAIRECTMSTLSLIGQGIDAPAPTSRYIIQGSSS